MCPLNGGVLLMVSHRKGSTLIIRSSIILIFSKVFQGNTDYTSIVGRILDPPIIARFIKINVKTYNGYPSLRVELYGCTDGMQFLMFETINVPKLSPRV